MTKRVLRLSALASLLALGTLNAQTGDQKKEKEIKLDEVVITDSRFELKKENSGKVVHKITSEIIEKNKSKSIVDLINRVAGIEINGNSSVSGQILGYYVRGGKTNEVVILIDGVQVVNPLQNSFDLRLLDLEQVESIEIIKGAASTLYGSGAATAVIDIRLKKAVKEKVQTSLGVFAGTNNTQNTNFEGNIIQGNISVNGTLKDFNYVASFSSFKSDGISAAKSENSNQKFEDDPFRRINFNLKLGYRFSDKFEINTFGMFNQYKNSYDKGSYADGENSSKDKNYRIGISPKYTHNNGSIHLNVAYSKFDADRVKTSFPGKSNGDNYVVNAYVKHKFNSVYAIFGIDYQSSNIETHSIPFGETEITKTVYKETPKNTVTDPYANIVYISNFGGNINAGLRLNNHSKYGNHFVYNINPSYRVKEETGYTKFFGSYSTAFVAPSLQDLYASWGNLELKPQESLTYEGGIEYKVSSFLINIVYFNREVDNIISYDSSLSKLINKGDVTIKGLEVTTNYDLTQSLSIKANYSYTKNDTIAIRIPKHKINTGISYSLKSNTNFSLDYQYVSDRDDTDFRIFPNKNTTLSSYSVVDFSANHTLNKNVKLFFTATNILNDDYEETLGYSTRGRNFKLGIRLQF